jgi:hypothetical protein
LENPKVENFCVGMALALNELDGQLAGNGNGGNERKWKMGDIVRATRIGKRGHPFCGDEAEEWTL